VSLETYLLTSGDESVNTIAQHHRDCPATSTDRPLPDG